MSESINLKEQNALIKCNIIIRDVEHFYQIVKWLNKKCGSGRANWSMGGRILRHVRRGKSTETVIYIFNPHVREEDMLAFKLMVP